MSIAWTTPPGNLFTSTIYDIVNESVSANSATNYSVISGGLPGGLSLDDQGNITGTVSYIEYTTQYPFVVRATDGVTIRDRTFNITIERDEEPSWSQIGFSVVGSTLKKLLVNRDFIDIQLDANVDTDVVYSLDRSTGKLPFGLTLSPTGRIYGVPKLTLAPNQAVEFSVDILANDAVNEYRQNFTFDVIDSNSFTVDNTNFILGGSTVNLIDLGNSGTVTLSSLQAPEYLNQGDLGVVLHDDKQYIPVTAFDPNPGKGPLRYSTQSTLPPNLSVDPYLGYLYGNLSLQADYSHRYQFDVIATKQDIKSGQTVSSTGTFNLTIVNQWYNNVTWPSSNLGTLIEGLPSELAVTAKQKDSTWPLNYYVTTGTSLPAGLSLSTSTGHIIGSATTSGNFTFKIAASTCTYLPHQLDWPVLSYPVTFNTFNLKISPVSTEYTSIWAKPFLIPTQRQAWDMFINDETIFLPEVLYRADDPTFGLQEDLRIFLEFGIERINLGEYAEALYQNLYERRLSFGSAKSAIARDKQGNHVYDAVYVDVVDDLDGAKTSIVINGVTYYPGSIDNIRNSLESIILDNGTEIKVDGQHLPKFMTTVENGQDYGYFKAAVLCYTLPGQSSKILNRIRASKFNFDNLSFFIDRLVVQNSADQAGTAYIVFNKQPIG